METRLTPVSIPNISPFAFGKRLKTWEHVHQTGLKGCRGSRDLIMEMRLRTLELYYL